MKRIKRYLMVFLFVLMQKIVIATPQVSDLLYWNDSIYHVYPSVFRNDARFQRLSSLIDSLYGVSTSNWNGYACTFEIDNDTLYLIAINDRFENDYMNYLFPSEKRKIMSSVSDTLYLGYGKAMYEPDLPFMVYENETTIVVEKGVLKSCKHNMNKSKSTQYGDELKLLDFVYSHIDWNSIAPKVLEKKPRTIVQFSVDSLAMIDNVILLKSSGNDNLDKEAIRVLKSLPGFRVSFFQGKYHYPKYNLSIFFDPEKRSKYISN